MLMLYPGRLPFCDPPQYAVPLKYAVLKAKIFHPKNRVLERYYCMTVCQCARHSGYIC